MVLIYLREYGVNALDIHDAWEPVRANAIAWCWCHVYRAACAVRRVATTVGGIT